MPRKKSPEGKTVDVAGSVLKTVRLELPSDLHQWLRVEAAKHGQSMAAYARSLVEQDWKAKTTKGASKSGE